MMTSLQYDTVRSVLVLLPILIHVKASAQDISNTQHFSDTKFNPNEYFEYPDNEERDREALAQPNQMQHLKDTYVKANGLANHPDKEESTSETLDKNIIWDRQWAAQLNLTQVSAVSMDPSGNIAIFHRGDRIWGFDTFDNANRFNPVSGPIAKNTVILLDKTGKTVLEWGKDMFYLPHGLTIDQSGNYWITDVAMHQVFKFDAQDIEKHMSELKRAQFSTKTSASGHHNSALFENSILKPSIVLGVAFEPGNDEIRFCKPTSVAVHTNGDFFVSDGYCNSRIIKFNKNGERILVWGRHWGTEGPAAYYQLPPPNAFVVPHALALASELNYIYVADRENGRVLCFFANNGTFHKEYKHPTIGTKIYSVAYAREKLYLVNGPNIYTSHPVPVRGFVLDIYSGKILSIFEPEGNMNNPHDLYVTENGAEIYVVELNNHKVYRFLQGVNDSHPENLLSTNRYRPKILVHPDTKDADTEKSNMTKLILGLGSAAISFIIICVAIAAIVARCQKRGCLLTMRKRMRWETERRENFKLSSLLENRRGRNFKLLEKRPNTRDFNKLSTEPETSEDERPENSLAKVI